MAWFGLDKLFLGTDLDAEQARSDRLDRELLTQNQQLVERGVWTEDQYDDFIEDISRKESTYGQNVTKEVNESFVEGLQEGVANIRNRIGAATQFAVTTPLKLIPWQVWVIAAIALALYLFGPRLLKKFSP
jgi:hypothetical protein